MTPREIVLANLNRADPPRPGLNFMSAGAEDWLYPRPGSSRRVNDMLCMGLGPSAHFTQKRWVEGDREYYDDPWGNLWVRMVDGSEKGEIHEPALRDWGQLETLATPDFDDPSRFQKAREAFARDPERFHVAAMPGWVFETSRYLRKMEVYFCDLIDYRDEVNRLHDLVTGLLERVIHQFAGVGADAIFFCEDLGVQDRLLLSPAMWREIFQPHYRRLVDAAHTHGLKVLMHSCGYNWDLLDDLAGVGIDVFQFDQPRVYDLPALAERLKSRRVALWSPIDIQQVLPTGDRQRIEDEARTMVDLFGGALILKNYPDLRGIGVQPAWDQWAYEAVLAACGL